MEQHVRHLHPDTALLRGGLYTCNNDGVLTAYDAKTGTRISRARVGGGGSFSASPIAADGKLYFANEDGDIIVARSGPKDSELAKNAVGEVDCRQRSHAALDGPTSGLTPTGYVVEGGINPGEVLASLPTGSASPIFSVTVPRGAFYVRVYTIAGASRGSASSEIRIFADVPVPPSAPEHLLGFVNDTSLALSWKNTFAGGAPRSLILPARPAQRA